MRTTLSTRRLVAPLGALLLAAAIACSDSSDPAAAPDLGAAPAAGGIWAGTVTAEATPGGLRVGNNTTRPIGYAVFATEILPVINWRPCVERTGCPAIIQGERRAIPASEIPGLEGGKGGVTFYWWHLVEGRDGRLQPDSVRAVEARL